MSEIINESFFNAVFPIGFKLGIVIAILRSGDIERISTKGQSKVAFPSKVIEKVVAVQRKRFLVKLAVCDEHQSAYRKYR